eukprot:TRINITY_DN80732_c0_g1_i1.p1 TRINITY_DN80732_c0_g1~~TRINITY_DN80732_c0_g1_i1.p1  ORF type:complete len:1469 (+),score=348.55 TRINITY_DN80732_c0_g1_i1:95-4501(+)
MAAGHPGQQQGLRNEAWATRFYAPVAPQSDAAGNVASAAKAKAAAKAQVRAGHHGGRHDWYNAGAMVNQSCDYCGKRAEGWPDMDRFGKQKFYCSACWDKYDALTGGDAEGSKWHDMILARDLEEEGAFEKDKLRAIREASQSTVEPSDSLLPSGSGDSDSDDGEDEDVLGELRDLRGIRLKDTGKSKDAAPAHIVVVVDRSGSMRNSDVAKGKGSEECITRLEAVKKSLKAFFEAQVARATNDIYSLVSFSNDRSVHFLGETAQRSVQLAGQLKVKAGERTHFAEGLVAAESLLVMQAQSYERRTPHVVVFSDGRPGDHAQMLSIVQHMVDEHEDIHIHAIAFGDSLDNFDYLQQLASIGNGAFVPAGLSLEALKHAFSSVSSTITMTQTAISAFSFRQSSSTSSTLDDAGLSGRDKTTLKRVMWELPNQLNCAKNCLTFSCGRSKFRYDQTAGGVGTFEQIEGRECDQLQVSMREKPFTKGGMRLVHGFKDSTVTEYHGCDRVESTEDDDHQSRMVAKLSRYADSYHNSFKVVSGYAKSSAVAIFYSRLFGQDLRERLGKGSRDSAKIVFVECFLYAVDRLLWTDRVEEDALHLPDYFIGERYLPGIFLKYNSNRGYINEEAPHSELAQAFSHYTFEMSCRRLMVLDVQGVFVKRRRDQLILSDPQVVSRERDEIGGHSQFGPGDTGKKGMIDFFKKHRCGPTCRMLGLHQGASAATSGDATHEVEEEEYYEPEAEDGGPAWNRAAEQTPTYNKGKKYKKPRAGQAWNDRIFVRKHDTMGTAIIEFSNTAARDAVLQRGNGAIIDGSRVEMKEYFCRKLKSALPYALFVAWGHQVEKKNPLCEYALLEYFDSEARKFEESLSSAKGGKKVSKARKLLEKEESVRQLSSCPAAEGDEDDDDDERPRDRQESESDWRQRRLDLWQAHAQAIQQRGPALHMQPLLYSSPPMRPPPPHTAQALPVTPARPFSSHPAGFAPPPPVPFPGGQKGAGKGNDADNWDRYVEMARKHLSKAPPPRASESSAAAAAAAAQSSLPGHSVSGAVGGFKLPSFGSQEADGAANPPPKKPPPTCPVSKFPPTKSAPVLGRAQLGAAQDATGYVAGRPAPPGREPAGTAPPEKAPPERNQSERDPHAKEPPGRVQSESCLFGKAPPPGRGHPGGGPPEKAPPQRVQSARDPPERAPPQWGQLQGRPPERPPPEKAPPEKAPPERGWPERGPPEKVSPERFAPPRSAPPENAAPPEQGLPLERAPPEKAAPPPEKAAPLRPAVKAPPSDVRGKPFLMNAAPYRAPPAAEHRDAVIHGPEGKMYKIANVVGEELAMEIERLLGIPLEEQHVVMENRSGKMHYDVDRKMRVKDLRFTQSSISDKFRDGRLIQVLLDDLHTGDVDSLRDLEPLPVVFWEGAWRSKSNRRLYILKRYKDESDDDVWVRVTPCLPDKEFFSKNTSTSDGRFVRVARSRPPSPCISPR